MTDTNGAHDDVWDDSELVTFWNEAREEYNKYHSISGHREKSSKQSADTERGAVPTSDNPSDRLPVINEAATTLSNGLSPGEEAQPGTATSEPAGSEPLVPPLPIGLGGGMLPQRSGRSGSNDGDMKNLLMSWYYAGYYTGLYEGQQKAWAEMQEKS